MFFCVPPGCLLGASCEKTKRRHSEGVGAPHRLQVLLPRKSTGGFAPPPDRAMGARGGMVRVIVWPYWLFMGSRIFLLFEVEALRLIFQRFLKA